MNDPQLNNLLKWSVANSSAAADNSEQSPEQKTNVSPEAINALFGGPSEADLMKFFMNVVDELDTDGQTPKSYTLDERRTAFENFEELIENIDNANNMDVLGLWTKVVNHLENEDADLRSIAAWCCAEAAQNNVKCQEKILLLGAIPTLVRLATEDSESKVRKRAIKAISATTRNYQPALDETLSKMPAKYKPADKLDGTDMESVDSLTDKLRADL